jgi:hypothetical protein
VTVGDVARQTAVTLEDDGRYSAMVHLEAVIASAEPSTGWRHRSRVPAFIVRHGRVPV